MIYRTIELSGYSNKGNTVLWYDGHIDECTHFELHDYDYGDNAEKELELCRQYIKKMEDSDTWLPGVVTAYINTYEIE